MSTKNMGAARKLKGLYRYLELKAAGNRPKLINLEVTKYCNAQCDFCPCWTIKGYPQLDDFSPIIKKFRPLVLSLNGGEPLLRKDIYDIIESVRPYCIYLTMITHGQLLTEEKFIKLIDKGLDQVTISLNYDSDLHDEERKIPGLYKHFSELIPSLTAKGHDNISFNTVIMEQNLDHIIPLAKRALEWGTKIGFSSYSTLKNDRDQYHVREAQLEKLSDVVAELIELKKQHGHITTSSSYLERIPEYFREGSIDGCQAGKNFIQITPDGMVKRCSEMEPFCHWSEYDPTELEDPNPCNDCWLACRGETEVKVTASRAMEMLFG